MAKKIVNEIVALISVFALISICFIGKTNAIIPGASTAYFWTSDTNIVATAVGDVNGDGRLEIVTAGTYLDGLRYVAQLIVWNSSTLTPLAIKGWFWNNNTQISSVAIGDVDNDTQKEIVTGGAYFDGTVWNAQLIVWNGTSLVAKAVKSWYWANDTQISSVVIGDVNGDNQTDIVTGGTYNDGIRANAQLIVWNGSSLNAQTIKGWFWSSTTDIASVAIGDVNGDNQTDVVTGGTYYDGVRLNSQLIVWNGSNLSAQSIKSWFWASDTQISNVALGDVDGDNQTEIVTGGSYNDLTRVNGQLIVWAGTNLVAEAIRGWFTTSNTTITSVAIGSIGASTQKQIVTCGQYYDGANYNAELEIVNGTSLALIDYYAWITTSNTLANSVSIGNFTTPTNRIVTGGQYFDMTRFVAQLRTWG